MIISKDRQAVEDVTYLVTSTFISSGLVDLSAEIRGDSHGSRQNRIEQRKSQRIRKREEKKFRWDAGAIYK